VPEGDTIFRAARRLHAALVGRPIERYETALPALRRDLRGRVVVDVRSRGKNLLFELDDGLLLHTHLLMRGSWHVYRPGEPWRKPRERMSIALHTHEWVGVAFDLPVARFVRAESDAPMLRALGPDLLDPAVDLRLVLPHLRAHEGLPLGVALMRQHIVAGIGNVYKSEVLFLEREDPFRAVAERDDETLLRVLSRARTLLARNLGGRARVTRRRYEGRLWVYDRAGKPCFTCGELVRMRRQGEDGRSTYLCPACQRAT
jgi:endonuclease VIII